MYLSIYPDYRVPGHSRGVTCDVARFLATVSFVHSTRRKRRAIHRHIGPFLLLPPLCFFSNRRHPFTCDYRWTATGLWPRYDGNAHFAICCPSCAIRGSPRSGGCALLLVWKNMQSYFFKFMQVFRICTWDF